MHALLLVLAAAALASLAAPGASAAPSTSTTTKGGLRTAAPNTECIQVQVVYRHGARTPILPTYPTDPNGSPKLYQPYGAGHLTQLGREMEYNLGQQFRKRYVGAGAEVANLLDEEYADGVLRVQTSHVERCQESAAASLAGMWPPGQRQRWRSQNTQIGQLWTPIAYHALPKDEDRAIAGTVRCPARDLEYHRVVTSEEYRRRVLRALGGEDNLRYLEKHSGVTYNFSDPVSARLPATLFSATQCQELLGMTVPTWIKKLYPEPLRSAATMYLKTLSYTDKLIRQSFGDLTTWILNATRNHETQPLFLAYSGHDSTVHAVLQAFELEPEDDDGYGIADFSSCVMIELHRDQEDGELGLKFFYRRQYGGKVIPMIPRGCNEFCPLDEIAEILSNKMYRPTESCDVPADHGALLREVHLHHVAGGEPSWL